MYRSTVDMYIDEWVHELLEEIERHHIKRVLIDSLGDLRVAALDEVRFKEYIYFVVAADRKVRREPVHDTGDRGALRRDQARNTASRTSLTTSSCCSSFAGSRGSNERSQC